MSVTLLKAATLTSDCHTESKNFLTSKVYDISLYRTRQENETKRSKEQLVKGSSVEVGFEGGPHPDGKRLS